MRTTPTPAETDVRDHPSRSRVDRHAPATIYVEPYLPADDVFSVFANGTRIGLVGRGDNGRWYARTYRNEEFLGWDSGDVYVSRRSAVAALTRRAGVFGRVVEPFEPSALERALLDEIDRGGLALSALAAKYGLHRDAAERILARTLLARVDARRAARAVRTVEGVR